MENQCKNCGRTYEAKTARSQFCSDRCRAAYHMREKRRKERKWYNEQNPFWITLVLSVLLGISVYFFAIHKDKISRLEKKVERYQDSVKTLPEEYQPKFPGI